MDDTMSDHSAVNPAAGGVGVDSTWLRDDHRIILYTLVSLALVLGGHRTWREYHRYRENAARRAKILRLVETSRREKERERKLAVGLAVGAEAVDAHTAIHAVANGNAHDERSAEFVGGASVPRASSSKSLSSSPSAQDLKARPENATNAKRPRERRRRGRDMYKEGIKQERKKSSASSSSLAPNSVSRHAEPSSLPVQATSGSDADASRSRSRSRSEYRARSGSHSGVRSDSASRSRSRLRTRHEEVDEVEVGEDGTSEDTPRPDANSETAPFQFDLAPPETATASAVQCARNVSRNTPNITSAATVAALTTNIKCRTPTPPLTYSGPSSNSSISGKMSDSGLSFSSFSSVSAPDSALARAGSPVLHSFNLDFDLDVNLDRRELGKRRLSGYELEAAMISQPVPSAPNSEEQRPPWLGLDSEDDSRSQSPSHSQLEEGNAGKQDINDSMEGYTHAPKTPSSSSFASFGGVSDTSANVSVSMSEYSISGKENKNSDAAQSSTLRTTSITTTGVGNSFSSRRKVSKNRSGSPPPPRFRSLSRPSGSGAGFVRGSPFHSNSLPLPMLPLTSLSAGVSPSSTPPPFMAGQREGAAYKFALETAKRRELEQRKEVDRCRAELERLRTRWNDDVERGRRRETELRAQLQLVTSQMHALSMTVSQMQMHPHPYLSHPQSHSATTSSQQQSTPSSSTFPPYPPPIPPFSSIPVTGPESSAGPGATSYPGSGPGSPYPPGTAQTYPYPYPYPYPYLYPYPLVPTPPHLLPRSMSRSISASCSTSGSRSGSMRGSDSAGGSTSGSRKASPARESQYALARSEHISPDFQGNLNFGFRETGEEKRGLDEWATRGLFNDQDTNSVDEDGADTGVEVGVSSELVEAILKRPSSIALSYRAGGRSPSAPAPAQIRSLCGATRSASTSCVNGIYTRTSSRVVEGRATSGDEGFRFASLSELGNPLPRRRRGVEGEGRRCWVVYDTDGVGNGNRKEEVEVEVERERNKSGEEASLMVMSPEEETRVPNSGIVDGVEVVDEREDDERTS